MKTIINIGTNQGNLTNQAFDKDFRDIKFPEVFERAREKFPEGELRIAGWVDMTTERPKEWIFEDEPPTPGIYAVTICWDPREGLFPNVAEWDGFRWDDSSPIVAFAGPFNNREEAKIWADNNDMEVNNEHFEN